MKPTLLITLLATAVATHSPKAQPVEPDATQSARTSTSERACGDPSQVLVNAASWRDVELACRGARHAIEFLAQAGLKRPDWIHILIVDRIPGEMDQRAVGCYQRDERRIVLLSYDAFEGVGEWFRLPASLELFVAAATHEVAHATAACNLDPTKLPLGAHEYIAYLAMFATMDGALRDQILSRYPGTGLRTAQQINTFVYLVNPPQFAVDSWRHFRRQPDKSGWIRSLATGEILQEDPSNDGP